MGSYFLYSFILFYSTGLYVIGHVTPGQDFSQMTEDPTLEGYTHWLSLVDHLKVKAFVELTVARTVREGLHHLVRISGMWLTSMCLLIS